MLLTGKQSWIRLGNAGLPWRTRFDWPELHQSLSRGKAALADCAQSHGKPELLILDEATSGLDLFARERLLDQIGKITQMENAQLSSMSPTMLRKSLLLWIMSYS